MNWRAALTGVCLMVAACHSAPPENFNVLPEPPPDGWAQLRIMHASADVRSVDVYTSDVSEPLLTDLAYGFAQGFVEIGAQDYAVQLRPAGESRNSGPTYSQDISLPSKERHTLVLAGSGDSLQFIELTDDLGRVSPGALRVVNASNAATSLDFANDGSVDVAGLAPFATARADTHGLQATSVSVDGTSYTLPARPSEGDVVIVITDTEVILLTFSFTVDVLSPQ